MSLIGFWNKLWKREAAPIKECEESKELMASASSIRYCELINKWRIEDLRAEVDTARRNKKKSSHLVAELAELENGK